MGRLGYTQTLVRDLVTFARENRAYWLVPLVLVLLLLGLIVVAGQGATPFIYTLF